MKFILNKDTLKIEDEDVINSGSVNYYEADVEYDESWNDLTIKAILRRRSEEEGTEIAVIGNKIFIDKNQLINKKDYEAYCMGFVGYTIEGEEKTYQVSTNLEIFFVRRGAGEIETQEPEIPTPSEWEKYIAQIEEMLKNAGGGSGGTSEESDPTVPEHVKNITKEDIENWNNGSNIDLSGVATKDDLNDKVDKVPGKSLIADSEIERLSKVDNYDDTELREEVGSKANKTELHSHENKNVLDNITAKDIENWNSNSEKSSEIAIQADEPTDENVLLWVDTDEEEETDLLTELEAYCDNYIDQKIIQAIGGEY